MAYTKRTRRVARRSRKGRSKSLATKVYKLAKVVNRHNEIQRVYQSNFSSYAANNGNLAVGATGSQIMFNPPLGTGFSERLSPRCELSSVDIDGYWATSSVFDVLRTVVFILRDSWEAGSTVGIMNNNNGFSDAPTTPLQPSSLCLQRYKVLWDSGPGAIGTSGGLHPARSFHKRINLKGLKQNFSSQATVEQNPIYIVTWGQQNPGVGPTYITTSSYAFSAQFHYNS